MPLEISSRSASVKASFDIVRVAGLIPPLGDNKLNIEDDSRSNKPPIEL